MEVVAVVYPPIYPVAVAAAVVTAGVLESE
jgi:hypothetical protein